MRNFLLTFIMLCATSAFAQQQLLLDKPLNKSDKLSYGFSLFSLTDAAQASEIGFKIDSILASKSVPISLVCPDMADLEIKIPERGVLQIGNNHIKYSSVQQAASKAAKFLTSKFIAAGQPTYSTPFMWGKEGYASYRIPSVVYLKDKTIVAIIEARVNALRDQAENDLVAKISTDGGQTWGSPIIIAEAGGASLNNPCVVYIEEQNKIVLLYQYYPPKTTEGTTAVGFEGDNISRIYTISSTNGGKSWSTPQDITRSAKHPEANSVCSGPGAAICLQEGPHKGRIVVPFNANGSTRWFNYLLYSDDCAESWKIADGESGYGTNESQVVEIKYGELLLNTRSHRYPEANNYTAPKDWNPWNFERVTRNRAHIRVSMLADTTVWHPTEVQYNLPDPTCQGSIIRVGDLLLLSNAASQHTSAIAGRPYAQTPPARINGSVRVSKDFGLTWSSSKRIYGDRLTEFQYSVLVDLGGGKIGCLFEAEPEVKFAVFDLEWLER